MVNKTVIMTPSKKVISPKKLLKSKWTAVNPSNKEKHFMVTELILPELPNQAVEMVKLEAVHSKRTQLIAWQQLNDINLFIQGWV